MSLPSDNQITITTTPAEVLRIGREIGSAKRTLERLLVVIDEEPEAINPGIVESKQFAIEQLRRISQLAILACSDIRIAREKWLVLVDQAD